MAKRRKSESFKDFMTRIGSALERKGGDGMKVKPHKRTRSTCVTCGRWHKLSACASHGVGSFKRAHPGTRGGTSGE